MIKFLIKKFIKNADQTQDCKVRESYGVLSGSLGILCNIFLFILKLTIGLMMNSVAILSDAFNNLSDTGSSIVAVVGAKLSNIDADNEHPFGHGRFEYIASLIISFIIMMVGVELFRESFKKIINPEPIKYNVVLIIILVASILIKIWMYSYNMYISKLISSNVNKAAALDSLNDVIATTAVTLTAVLGSRVSIPLDGIAGVIVSMLIIFTGYSIAKDTVNILLGMSPSEEMTNKIIEIIKENEMIIGAHDLRVHDYGPGRIVGSVHTEILDINDLVKAHSVIDIIEKRIYKELGIDIVIHIDPISKDQIGPIS